MVLDPCIEHFQIHCTSDQLDHQRAAEFCDKQILDLQKQVGELSPAFSLFQHLIDIILHNAECCLM